MVQSDPEQTKHRQANNIGIVEQWNTNTEADIENGDKQRSEKGKIANGGPYFLFYYCICRLINTRTICEPEAEM